MTPLAPRWSNDWRRRAQRLRDAVEDGPKPAGAKYFLLAPMRSFWKRQRLLSSGRQAGKVGFVVGQPRNFRNEGEGFGNHVVGGLRGDGVAQLVQRRRR